MNFRGIFNATLGRLILPVSSAPSVPVEGEVWDQSHVIKARLDGTTVDVLTSADKGVASGVCPLGSDLLVPAANLPTTITGGVPVGTILDFSGLTAPSGYTLCNGASLTRAGTFAALFSALTAQRVITYISSKNYHVSSPEGVAGFFVGMRVEIDGAADTVATVDTVGNNFTVSTIDSISAALAIMLPWGASDLVTFKIPDFRRKVGVGSGGTGTSVIGNSVGQTGGEEAHVLLGTELAAHTHGVDVGPGGNVSSGGGASVAIPTSNSTSSYGGNTAHNTMQPSVIINKIIKV